MKSKRLILIGLLLMIGLSSRSIARQETINVDNLARFKKQLGHRMTMTGTLLNGGKEGLILVLDDKSNDAIVLAPIPPVVNGSTRKLTTTEASQLLQRANLTEHKFEGMRVKISGVLSYLPFKNLHNSGPRAAQGESSHLYFSTLDSTVVKAP
jgi:hypothetical protein